MASAALSSAHGARTPQNVADIASRRAAVTEQTGRERIALDVIRTYQVNGIHAFADLEHGAGAAGLFEETHALLSLLASRLDEEHGPSDHTIALHAVRGLERLASLGAMMGRLAS